MANKSIGFIETFGLAACVAAADAAVKTANVKLLGFEYAKGDGMCTVKVEGNVGACKAAIEAGKRAAENVNGTLSGTKSTLLKARPADGMMDLLVNNRETVGGEIALAEGYRPKGDSKKAVLVKNWKPKEEPKEEAPIVEAPESPVEEDLKEEADEEEADPESQEPAIEVVVEEAVEEAKAEEAEAEAPEEAVEEAPVVAPETEIIEEVVAPEPVITEEVVAPESEVAEEVVAPEETEAEEAVVPEIEEAVEAETSETEAPKKSTSTGKRRSRRKKKTDE